MLAGTDGNIETQIAWHPSLYNRQIRKRLRICPKNKKPPPAPGEVLKALDIEHLFVR